ncbi:MAG: ABC-type transport auxiliary lipoprotein family protein [bacterium]
MKLFLLNLTCSFIIGLSLNCGGVPPTFYYRVSHEGVSEGNGANNAMIPVTLGIAQCTADILYEGDKIVYRDSPYEVQFYHYRRWIAPPRKIVTETILKQFRESGAFQRVVSIPSSIDFDYLVKGRILAFEEWDDANGWFGIVTLEFKLQDPHTKEVLWENVFSAKAPASQKKPVEVVKAISSSLYTVIDNAVSEIKQNLLKAKI